MEGVIKTQLNSRIITTPQNRANEQKTQCLLIQEQAYF